MKSNNITTDRTLNALRRQLSRTLVLLSLLTLSVGQMWAAKRIYIDFSAINWPADGACLKIWDGSANQSITQLSGNLYYADLADAVTTSTRLYFKRLPSNCGNDYDGGRWNEANCLYSSSYNCYKFTGWSSVSASYNINTVTPTNHIYFVNENDWANSYRYFVIGHDQPTAYSKVYAMTPIPHTKLLYVAQTADTWNDATYYAFCGTNTSWGDGDWGSSNLSNAANRTSAWKSKQDLSNGRYYLFHPTTVTENASYDNPNFKANTTIHRKVLLSGASSYTDGTSNDIGTVSVSGYVLNGANTTTTTSATIANGSASATIQPTISSETTYTASPNDGYSFVGWFFSAPSTSDTPASTELTFTRNIGNLPSAHPHLYAAFRQETTHTVTISEYCSTTSTEISSSTRAIGESAYTTITAPEIYGYNFTSWTIGSGIYLKAGDAITSTTIHVKTLSSGDYTLTARYTEDLSSPWYVSGQSTDIFGGWGASGRNMQRKTGHSAEKKFYYTIDATKVINGSTSDSDLEFKIYNSDGDSYRGNSGYWVTRENYHPELSSSSGSNMQFRPDAYGTYEFMLDCESPYSEASPKLTVTFNPKYKVTFGKLVGGNTVTAKYNDVVAMTSGQYVILGSYVYFSQTPLTGYTFDGWYSAATGGTRLSSNENYRRRVLGDCVTYSNYTENMFDVEVRATTGGTVTPTSVTAMGQVTGGAISATADPGYSFVIWAMLSGSAGSFVDRESANTRFMPTKDGIIRARFSANQYTITFNRQSGSGGTASATVSFNNNNFSVSPVVVPTRTGYTFGGYYTATGGGGVQIVDASGAWQSNKTDYLDADGKWIYVGNKTVYAKWTAVTYPITFVNTGTGYASGGPSSTTASYNTAMPAVTAPTASTGYKFMGYFDAAGGEGTQYYTSTGTSAHVWNKTSGATLYAHYEPATITSVTLNHEAFEYESAASGDADKDYVSMTANPTITPSGYVTPINVTWELQYSNGNPVVGHDPIYEATYRAKFSIVGLARGTYQLHATVRTGDTRGSGTVISTYDKPFQIASDYDVTVQYMCDGVNIAPSTTIKGKPLVWSDDITAPTLFGYTFARWDAGDGIVIKSGSSEVTTSTANPINIKATFDGTLTAVYTKKNIVYFKNTLGWSNVYVYFYGSSGYWNADKGAGSNGGIAANAMTQIAGTDVWYFEYTGSKERHIAFTKDSQPDTYENFYGTKASYPSRGGTQTDSEFSNRGFNAGTPMFVPNTTKKETKNGVDYFSNGYWTTYLGNTGYTLKIYNQRENGRVELKSIPFTASGAGNEMPYTVEVDLEAGKTYGFKFERSDGIYYYNSATYTVENNEQAWSFPFDNSDHYAAGLQTNASGTYKFTLSCNSTNGDLYISIKYPVKQGDFRLNYTDNATWSQGAAHTINTWKHPSKVITARANGVDTVSFFVSKGTGITAKIRWEKATDVTAGSVTWGAVGSWTTQSVNEPGVYNFRVVQNAAGDGIASITNIGKYDGNYYIRVDALAGKWDSYRTDHDHLMTYTEFSENRSTNTFGELYSHYKAKWCPRNTNIKFCIANDYSPCISDTLTEDIGTTFSNMTSGGTLKYEENGDHSMKYPDDGSAYLDKYSANVRFMWNRTTNKISRAYVAAATSTEAKFLVLQGSGTTNANIYSSLGNDLTANPPGANAIRLQDDQNWIYETTIMANPSALIKLYATYNTIPQYFCGTSDATFVNGTTALELLGGSASSKKYSVRVIYDFKTNRLVCAWIPTGHSQDITGDVTLNSDVMFVREHQEEAQCITFANDDSKLSSVKTVYGSMKFNRWILGNRANPTDTDPDHCDTDERLSANHPPLGIGSQLSPYERALYFISFPFNVKLSEVFGFGQYGVHWIIEYYDGLTRAQKGYWIDSDPNWKFVDPDMAETYVLQKGVGYILCLNLSKMAYNDREFWSNNISETELFFPSQSTISEITAANETIPALSDEYRCTINRPGEDGDRRIKDSYWRCIGVPGYSTYNGSLTTNGSAITWKNDDSGEFDISKFPFLYAWNTADNSLTAQATTNYRFKATHAYLVQNGNQIVWSKGNFRNSIVARRQKAEDIINTDWRLTISRNEQVEDQAYVRMSDNEDVTEEFDFGQDLVKELNSGRSNIYSFIGYEKCAANSMPVNTTTTTIVPLGIKTSATGDYTIALPDGASGVNIHLVDAETGERTNLSAGLDYTVTLEAGDYNDRFFLEIAPIQHIATGIDEINGEANGSTHKVLINGILYIVRDGKVYDARGSRVE